MQRISFIKGDYVFRWTGGAFVAVWKSGHEDEHVPYDMVPIPQGINRSHATRREIEFVADNWLSVHAESEETTADLLREVLTLTDQVVSQITDEEIQRKYQELMARVYGENI